MMKTHGHLYLGRWISIRTGIIYQDDDNILVLSFGVGRSRKLVAVQVLSYDTPSNKDDTHEVEEGAAVLVVVHKAHLALLVGFLRCVTLLWLVSLCPVPLYHRPLPRCVLRHPRTRRHRLIAGSVPLLSANGGGGLVVQVIVMASWLRYE